MRHRRYGRIINISSSRSAGYSTGVRYNRSTAWGDFTFSSMGEKTLVRREKILPNSLPTTSVNKRYVPMRMTTSFAWSRGPWEAGFTNVYGGRYWVDSSNAAIARAQRSRPLSERFPMRSMDEATSATTAGFSP